MDTIDKKKKSELVELVKDLKDKLAKLNEEIIELGKEFDRYKAAKSGQIGHGATRNPNA